MALGLAAATAAIGDELAPFLAAHQQASSPAQQGKWSEAAKTYGAFAAERPQDLCAPLASILQGILLRRDLGQPSEARSAFLRAAGAADTPFGRSLREVARAWLARLQMEPIEAALRRYWVDRVEYPEALDGLVARKLIEREALVDPWGKPFVYTPGKLRLAPDVPRQAYTLSCSSIPGDSRQLKPILKASAEFARKFQLKAIGGVKPLAALIAVADKPADKPVHVAEGEKLGSASLIKLTPKGAVLVEGELVAILTR